MLDYYKMFKTLKSVQYDNNLTITAKFFGKFRTIYCPVNKTITCRSSKCIKDQIHEVRFVTAFSTLTDRPVATLLHCIDKNKIKGVHFRLNSMDYRTKTRMTDDRRLQDCVNYHNIERELTRFMRTWHKFLHVFNLVN